MWRHHTLGLVKRIRDASAHQLHRHTLYHQQSGAEKLMSSCKCFSIIDHSSGSKMPTWTRWMEAMKFSNEHCK